MQSSDESTLMELSALADGQCTAQEADRAVALWRQSAQARQAWHGYHLIGDVMRSQELASESDSVAFLRELRVRLDAEPVPLAPGAVSHTGRRSEGASAGRTASAANESIHRRWSAPLAVAASFMALTVFGLSMLKNGGDAGSGAANTVATVGGGAAAQNTLSLQPDLPGLISLNSLNGTPEAGPSLVQQKPVLEDASIKPASFEHPELPQNSVARTTAALPGNP